MNAGEKIREYSQKKEYCLLILFSLMVKGIRESEIKEVFGEVGISRLNTLLSENVLSKDMNGVIGKVNHPINVSTDAISNIVSIVIDECYKFAEINEGLNYIYFRTGMVNREKIMPLVVEKFGIFQKEINEILTLEENAGNDRIFYSLCTDTLIPKK